MRERKKLLLSKVLSVHLSHAKENIFVEKNWTNRIKASFLNFKIYHDVVFESYQKKNAVFSSPDSYKAKQNLLLDLFQSWIFKKFI